MNLALSFGLSVICLCAAALAVNANATSWQMMQARQTGRAH